MQFADQHLKAIAKTVRAKTEVTATVFSDKVKDMGTVTVEKGRITIFLDFLPGMVSQEATRDFLIDAIGLSLKACYEAKPEAFDPFV